MFIVLTTIMKGKMINLIATVSVLNHPLAVALIDLRSSNVNTSTCQADQSYGRDLPQEAGFVLRKPTAN